MLPERLPPKKLQGDGGVISVKALTARRQPERLPVHRLAAPGRALLALSVSQRGRPRVAGVLANDAAASAKSLTPRA